MLVLILTTLPMWRRTLAKYPQRLLVLMTVNQSQDECSLASFCPEDFVREIHATLLADCDSKDSTSPVSAWCGGSWWPELAGRVFTATGGPRSLFLPFRNSRPSLRH
jgi:hypothetical protein